MPERELDTACSAHVVAGRAARRAGPFGSGVRLIAANGLLARFCNGVDAASPVTHAALTLIG